ncbi:MAG TPA: histidine kinase [Natronosporangium sp.]
MELTGQPTPPPPRHSWGFAVAFLCLAMPAAAGIAAHWGGPAAGVVAATAFALPLLYAVPAGRVVWARWRDWLLAGQALLTYLPFAAFGGDWIAGLPGLLGALLLLTVAAPVSWLLFVAALAVEGLLRLVVGVPHLSSVYDVSVVLVVPVYAGLALFGLVRLADLVSELHATRTELATLTVGRERLRAAVRLRAAIGDRLDTVAARARAAAATLATAPDRARAELATAGGEARQALEQVRMLVADDRREPVPDPPATEPGAAAGSVAPRLARAVLALVLVTFAVQLVLAAVLDPTTSGPVRVVSVVGIVALVALQLYHSAGWREQAGPPGWRWTLAAQLLLTLLGFVEVLHPSIHGLGGFVAGSLLLLLPRVWGWLGFAAVQLALGVHTLMLPYLGAEDLVYQLLLTITTGLVVYGLSWLTGLAVALAEARREVARLAMVRERLRVAQDTHDLLGMGLSAVALKCDLAGRLIGRADGRAAAELAALAELAERARAEVLAVTGEPRQLSLRAELAAATEVLGSAGVAATVRTEPPEPRLPEPVDAVLATVLREAVTNVVRHAAASRCEIVLTVDRATARLRVSNDGAGGRPGDPSRRTDGEPPRRAYGGRGLTNLAGRAGALGGDLATTVVGDRFELSVWLPLPDGSAGEQPLAAGDPAEGVDQVVGRPVLHEEP